MTKKHKTIHKSPIIDLHLFFLGKGCFIGATIPKLITIGTAKPAIPPGKKEKQKEERTHGNRW